MFRYVEPCTKKRLQSMRFFYLHILERFLERFETRILFAWILVCRVNIISANTVAVKAINSPHGNEYKCAE